MKKTLLFLVFALLGLSNVMAYDADDFDSYLAYANRLSEANVAVPSVAALDAAIEAADAETDKEKALADLKAAVKTFIATATGDTPLYVECGDKLTSIDAYTEAGWTFGESATTGGSNIWYTQSPRDGRTMGNSKTELTKWGDGTSNWAKCSLYELPAGSYTFSFYAAATPQIAYAYYKINDGEAVTFELANYGVYSKSFYADEAMTSFEMGVVDYDGKSGWVCVSDFNLLYAGSDVLAPYKAQLAEALTDANKEVESLAGAVPAGVISTLQSVMNSIADAYSTQEEYEAAVKTLKDAVAEAENAKVTYSEFNTEYAKIIAFLADEKDSEAKTALQNTLSTQSAAAQSAATYADILAAYNAMEEAYRTYQYAQADEENPVVLYDSGSITSLNGWVHNGAQDGNNGNSDWYVTNGSLAMWGTMHENWAYRTITNLPKGLYQLSVIVASDDPLKLKFGEMESDIEGNTTARAITQSFYLEEPAETLQFGLYSDNGKWVDFNNMKLEYKGEDAVAAVRNEYQSQLTAAKDYLVEYDGLVPQQAMDDFSDYLGDEDPYEYETVEALEEAKATLAQKIEGLTALKDAYADYLSLKEKLEAIDATLSDEELEAALADAADAVAKSATVEEVNAVVEKLEAVYRVYGMKTASIENPFLVFETGDITSLEGWVTDGTSDSNNGNNLWYLSTRTSDPVGATMEMWGSVASNYAYVPVANLPAGAYRLTVIGASSEPVTLSFNGEQASEAVMLSTSEEAYASALFVLGEAQESTLVGLNAPATWVAIKNIQLEYLGTDNEITIGINAVAHPSASATSRLYNLSGQAVDASYKGIVIKNGKKYWQK